MGLSVAEDQALRAAVRETGSVFQFGTQQRSSAYFRRACEIVRNGRIGKLRHINVWCIGSVPGGSTAVVPVPEGFDYDRWLGPAPFKPHREDLCSADSARKTWWFNSDYALGFIAGWGVHPLDIAYWGYPEMMSAPLEVSGTCTIPSAGACDTATTWDVSFRFASGVTMSFRGLAISANVPEVTSGPCGRAGRTCDHGTRSEARAGCVDRGTSLRSRRSGSGCRGLRGRAPAGAPTTPRLPGRSVPPACGLNVEDSFQSDVLCHQQHRDAHRPPAWDPKEGAS
jgi:predicted dehydrogenase